MGAAFAAGSSLAAEPVVRHPVVSSRRVELLIVAALGLSAFGLLVNSQVVLVGDCLAILAAAVWITRWGVVTPVFRVVALLLYLLVVLYILSCFGSNFVGVYPALLGVRKTLPPWIFLLVGIGWPAAPQRFARRLILLTTGVTLACLVLHNVAPATEAAITRSAGTYTALYAGAPRLQGMLAGPFHASLAGVILIVAGVGLPDVWTGRWIRVVALGAGVLTLLQANVRSGWIAALAGVVILGAVAPGRTLPRVLRLPLLLLGAAATVVSNVQALAFRSNAALESLTHLQTDSRLLNRVESYREAGALIRDRPFLGWGPGSAADTLGRYFNGAVHVTPHNMFLAYAVEAGVLAALAVAGVIGFTAVALIRTAARSRFAATGLALLSAFVVFGATGTAVDAAPISWVLLLLVGLAVASRTVPADPRAGDENPGLGFGW